ncbi:MAG: hypothetical protein FWE39_09915, partial [Nocardiaceae bacterium]|nr:hypothetical protein [Nocardiaceae bacterium]
MGEPTAVEARAAETVAAAVAEPSPAEPEPSPAEPEPSLAEPEPSPAEGNADGPTVETGPDAALVEGEGVGVASSGARGRLSWRLVAVLGAAAVVVGAFAAVAAFRPGAQVSNTAYVDIATTSEVTDAARSALIALSEYSPDAIDQYPDK